jgi:tetratricopeptide (TPR) repeat protein
LRRTRIFVAALLLGTVLPGGAPGIAAPVPEQTGASQTPFETEIAAAKVAMMSDPDVALKRARKATLLAAGMTGTEAAIGAATGHWLEGEALTRLNHPEQAKPVIEAALETVTRIAPGTKLHGDLLKSKASIASLTGEVQPALATLHQAYRIYEGLNEPRAQAIVLQNIGSIYSDARDYPRVLSYYEQANDVFDDDPALTVSSHNNRGNAFRDMGEFTRAEHEIQASAGRRTSDGQPSPRGSHHHQHRVRRVPAGGIRER